MSFTSEVYLTKKFVSIDEWKEFIKVVSNYNGFIKSWKIIIFFKNNEVHYFVDTKCSLPPSINGLKSFILKKVQMDNKDNILDFSFPLIMPINSNAIDIKNHFDFKHERVKTIVISIRKLKEEFIRSKVVVNTVKNKVKRKYRFYFGLTANVLSINFESNYNLVYKGAPKYLDISKCLHLLISNQSNSILSIDAFPYLQGSYFLEQSSINFDKHSIVFGSSGCGKSKFLSLFINNINKNDLFNAKYKIVVIDPHASLENDIGGLGKVIDFKHEEDSINLFSNDTDEVVVSVELLLDVFKGLIPNNYNSKLERVLRHALYLLLMDNKFNFKNLRRVLLDLEYRNELIKVNEESLPISVVEFFLTEFNEIKTKSYTEALAPIIALIDEVGMIPIFNKELEGSNLKETVQSNLLTVFSFDRTKLGDRVTKTVAGLVMQQLFTLVQNYTFDEHIIFIVDEVAVVENPILDRFLAEARKYNLSLILAGQYFNGISNNLQKSIFANVVNYYMFRVSKEDASILVDNFNMKVPLNDTREQKIKIITELQDRECLIRINSNGYLLPTMKCRTLDFKSIPRIKKEYVKKAEIKQKQKSKLSLFSNNNVNLNDLLRKNSTSRKVVKK